jgi:antagonist of KipI
MSIVVTKQGILDTIQDEGRFGYQHLGINPTGCMDSMAASVANILAGNDRCNPVVELHFPAACFQFQDDYLIAIAGADFQPTVNDKPIPINTAVWITSGSTLKFTHLNKGSRCYMAIQGRWDLEMWTGSFSTNLKAAVGGYEGRALRKNDEIKITGRKFKLKNKPAGFALPIKADASILYSASNTIRCLRGNEYNFLTNDARETLELSSFQISLQSDRMGYRLQGPSLQQGGLRPLLSSAVTRGTIQLIPSGQLIILMADHQTTGGYPKIAHVISSDFATLAQMRPNEKIQFQLVTHQEAEDACIQQQQQLQELENEVLLQYQKLLNTEQVSSVTEGFNKEDETSIVTEEGMLSSGLGNNKSARKIIEPVHLPDTDERISSSIFLDTPTSTITKRVTYSLEDKILEVELKEGGIYQYLPFPFTEWTRYKDEIVTGKSLGQFYNYIVKQYDYREVKLS